MKVFQINSTCGYGSTGRIAVDIQREVEREGGEGMIAYGRYTAPDGVNAYKITSEWGVRLHGVLSRLTDRHGMYSRRATRRLVQVMRAYDPDIVHLHNVHGYYLHVPTLFRYLKESGKPVVWTLHDCWTFTGHCAHFDFHGCDRWQTGCHHCPQKDQYPVSVLADASKRNYAQKKALFTAVENITFVTPSRWLAEFVKRSFFKGYPVRVIHNGIDLHKFKPTDGDFRRRYGVGDKQIILGVASVWTDRKGLDDFVKLQPLLRPDQQIVLVGMTDAQLAALPEGIIGIKRTNSVEELAQIYTAADAFFNPTYEENYPTTNLEAISCGTPVVTYRTGGSPESVSEGNGFVVEQGDLAAAVAAFDRVNGCAVDMHEAFDASRRFKEYVALYQELLKGRDKHGEF